jgi:type IV secretion system protein VirB11
MSATPTSSSPATHAPGAHDVYLHSYLEPFRPWLERPDVSEILVNRPGEVWIEQAGIMNMRCVSVPAVDDALLQRLATQIARVSHQAINREHPLLAATLPGGERVQMISPPATRRHWALAIRRHSCTDLALDDFTFARAGAVSDENRQSFPQTLGGLREALAARQTLLISGGTSSGKTTFLNALLKEIPNTERIVTVEDTPEIRLGHPNSLGLVAVKGDEGEARVSTDDLLQACLRLRPDRIILGEVRGSEAITFLRAINTGHPGSFTTIHANTPSGALEQLALLVMQSGLGFGRTDALAYIRSLIDVVVQLGRVNGQRRIMAIQPVN